MNRIIICTLSYGGNTDDVAEIIENTIPDSYNVQRYDIGWGEIPDLSSYDLIIVGTFTYGKGAVPDDFKDFILKVGYKPDNIAIFGTGDTQFGGDDLFCHAVDKLHKFYNSKYPKLKIEQSPRNSQEEKVKTWTREVLKQWQN